MLMLQVPFSGLQSHNLRVIKEWYFRIHQSGINQCSRQCQFSCLSMEMCSTSFQMSFPCFCRTNFQQMNVSLQSFHSDQLKPLQLLTHFLCLSDSMDQSFVNLLIQLFCLQPTYPGWELVKKVKMEMSFWSYLALP